MGGSSNLACSEVYHGGAPFNQLENIAARDAILSIPRGSGQVYIAFHSYQQDFIYPWSFTFDPADNKAELVIMLKILICTLHKPIVLDFRMLLVKQL